MFFMRHSKWSNLNTVFILVLAVLLPFNNNVFGENIDFAASKNSMRVQFGDGKNSYGELKRFSTKSNPTYFELNHHDALQLNYSRLVGHQMVHFTGFQGPEEHNLNVGLTFGKTTLSFSSGSGSKEAWNHNAYIGFNNTYKNGFTPTAYSFTGAGINYQITSNFNATVGGLQADLKDRVDTQSYYLSVGWRRLSGSWTTTERNGFNLANTLDLSYNFNGLTASYHEFTNYNDYFLRKIQLDFTPTRRGRHGLSFESGVSPFTGHEETRIMWRYSGTFKGSRGHIRYAAAKQDTGNSDGEESEAAEGQKSYGKVIALGVGAAGIAAAVGSSSGNGDSQPGGFEAQHGAARDVLNRINPTSVRENREYGGWVYRSLDGSFASTNPVRGQLASVNIGSPLTSVPASTVATASYHTHGGPDPRFVNEQFSPQDIAVDKAQRVDGYLGTPAGSFQYHNYRTGAITVLGRIAN